MAPAQATTWTKDSSASRPARDAPPHGQQRSRDGGDGVVILRWRDGARHWVSASTVTVVRPPRVCTISFVLCRRRFFFPQFGIEISEADVRNQPMISTPTVCTRECVLCRGLAAPVP
jgi:hypothetical protein